MTAYRHIIFLIVIVAPFLFFNIDSVAPCLSFDIDSDEYLLSSDYRGVKREGRDGATGQWKEIVHKESGIVLRLVHAGEFDMGSPSSGRTNDGPVHRVKINEPFYIGKYEVTQKEWKAVMGSNPSRWKGDNLPVEKVSWNNAQEYCRKAGGGLRLPSEAEWEYACRAGSKTRWCFGDNESALGEYAWYRDNSRRKTHEVGTKKPNAWGLYDMHGNVYECCEDVLHTNYNDAPNDGRAWTTGGEHSGHVVRGGSYYDYAWVTCSATRFMSGPGTRSDLIGFRVVVAAGAVCATLCADDEDSARDRLVPDGGDTHIGLIEKIDEDGTVYLKTQGTEKSLTVPITQLRCIYFNVHNNLPPGIIKRAFVYTLIDGTRITGRMVKWADEKLTIFNEYGREIEFGLKNIRHISTSPAGSLYVPWNTGSEDILVLRDGRQIKCELLPLVPVRSESGRMIVEKVEYKVGEETKSISITEVNGLVFPRKPPSRDKKPQEGWYALVSMLNYDCLPGVIDSMEDGKLRLITQYMGVVNIDRRLIHNITFSTSLSFYYGHTLICDEQNNRVVELDMQMKEVWSYGVTHPYHATRLQNGNILITSYNGHRVIEVDYQKQIVWKKVGLNYPTCAIRLKNGNTLIAERDRRRIIEVKPDGSIAGTYFEGQCYAPYFEELPNGNILVCDLSQSRVFESTVDGKNKIVRQWAATSATCARALPDGRIAVLEPRYGRIVIKARDGKHLNTITDINHWTLRFAITGEGNILVAVHPGNNGSVPPKLREYSLDGKLISEKAFPKNLHQIFHIEQN